MADCLTYYIGGSWVEPLASELLDVENPATEKVCGRVALAGTGDVDRAVAAAYSAFPEWSRSSREDRLALLGRIRDEYQNRYADLAAAMTEEMGCPQSKARDLQAV